MTKHANNALPIFEANPSIPKNKIIFFAPRRQHETEEEWMSRCGVIEGIGEPDSEAKKVMKQVNEAIVKPLHTPTPWALRDGTSVIHNPKLLGDVAIVGRRKTDDPPSPSQRRRAHRPRRQFV